MKNFLGKIISHEITSAVITLLAGIGLVIFPDVFAATVCYVLGGLALFFALSCIIKYIIYRTSFFSLGFGIALAVIGTALIAKHENVISILPFTVGIFLLINSAGELVRIIDYKKTTGKGILALVIPTVLTLTAGLVLVLYPFESVTLTLRIVGGCLIYSSAENLFRLCYIKSKLDKEAPIEGTFLDVSEKD